MNWLLLQNSLLVAVAATALAAVVGICAALALTSLPHKFRNAALALAIVALAPRRAGCFAAAASSS